MHRSRFLAGLIGGLLVLALCTLAAPAQASFSDDVFRAGATSRATLQHGYGIDGGLGPMPMTYCLRNVAAATAANVLAATAIPATASASSTTVVSGITNPDYPRNLTITGSAAAALSNVIIHGTNYAGLYQTETITGTGATTVVGNKAFKKVNRIVIYSVTTPGGATFSVGVGDKFGLPRPIAATTDVVCIDYHATDGTAWVTPAAGTVGPSGYAVSATYDTVDPETTVTEGDSYLIYFNAEAW